MMKDLAMHILDITENSTRAGATEVEVTVAEDETGNILSFSVQDNGKGMSKEFLEEVRNPFATSRTTRKVGLGIPMLEQTCLQCGGHLVLDSTEGVGTLIKAQMAYDNIDRPPMGDVAGTVFLMVMMNPAVDYTYVHMRNGKEYHLDTKEIREVLDGVPLDEPSVQEWLKENIKEGLAEIQ